MKKYSKAGGKKAGMSKFEARAGGKAMAGRSGAAPAMPGKTSTGGRKGNNKFAADTGSGRMAGKTGAMAARKA